MEEIDALRTLADSALAGRSGVRLFGQGELEKLLSAEGGLGRLAADELGQAARPVRAIMFDKTDHANWVVGWHQDRTIAVRARADLAGYGPWSLKAGVVHVEPPFDVIARMVTLRAHLDDCDSDNAPLLIVPGSHRLGRIPAEDMEAVAFRYGYVAGLAKAGDVWLYATSIVHASERASAPRRRRVLQVDYSSAELPPPLQWLGIA